MVNISPKTTKSLAISSKLRSNPDEDFLNKYTVNLNSILDYVSKLQAVNTQNHSGTEIIEKIYIKDLREDIPHSDQIKYQKIRSAIIQNFPLKQGDFLEIPGRIVQ